MARKKMETNYACSDATRDLVLSINARDIAGAVRKENDACAAANAICRQAGYKEARVYKTTTYVKKPDGSWLRFITPRDLYMEIMVFDRGGKMLAGDYKLLAPKGHKKLGQHLKPTGRKLKTGKPSTSPHIVKNVRDTAPKGRNHLAALFK